MSKKVTSITPPHAQCFEQAIYPGTSQSIAIGAASVAGAAVGASTTLLQLCATIACFVAIGPTPTAAAGTSLYVPANVPVLVGCNPGDKVAVIQATAAGTLYVTEAA